MRVRKRPLRALCLSAVAATFLATAAGNGVSLAADGTAAAEGTILGAGRADVVEGEYIVALEGTPSRAAKAAAGAREQAREVTGRHGGAVKSVYSAAFRGFAVKATEAQAKRIAADPDVRYVQTNNILRAVGSQPSPPSWGIDRIDGKKDGTYTYPNEGEGVTAYVLDTGTDLRHANFEGRAKSGYDFIDNDADASDCHGHGTHVAGTIGSKDYGVAKKVSLVAVRVLNCQGSGSTAQIVNGMDWVAKNAAKPAIGNMSLGGPSDPALDEGVKGAINAGVAMAVAAGNDSKDACNTSPARLPEAITLGSTDSNDGRSSFSNYGSCLDLFAPGGQIVSTKNGGGSTTMSGTSMATPHTAGAAALYLSAHPNATTQEVRDALVNNAQSGVVTNPGSGSPNKFLDVTKLGTPADPGTPTAAFTANCSATEPRCSFDASASKDSDGQIASYAWDFGDSTTGEGATPTHTYTKPGTYQVTLTVTDNTGKKDTETRSVQAGTPTGQPPAPSFTVSCWYEACDFDASQTRDADNDIATYTWKFGDGQTGTGLKTTHNYPAGQKNYTAELAVTDKAGNTATTTKQIQCWDFGGRAFCFTG